MRSVTLTVGWVVCVVLVAATLARWTGLDVRSTVLVAASTGAPVLLLPAWPVALVACGLQQRWLALVAVVLIVVDLVAIAPLVAGGRRASEGLQVRVLALNVQYDHPTGPAVTRQVLAEHPDIVVLSELAPVSLKGLDLSSYPYTSQVPAGPVSTGGIWSRWPIVTGGTRVVLEQPLAQATIRLPDGQLLHVLQVHVHSPTSNDRIPTWRAELRSMRGVLAGAHGLTIVAGDFNSSRTDPDFAALLGGSPGFADAADGQGLLPTWPSGKPLVPPVLRLDHVLISRGIGVHGVRVLGPTGATTGLCSRTCGSHPHDGLMTDYDTWLAVDTLIADKLLPGEPVHALEATAAAGMPAIAVSAPQGALLELLALSIGARRILEVGTLGGYSTIWMAKALPPDGELISLEFSAEHAEVARASIGDDPRVTVIVGPALETLPTLTGPFDLTFIDADKVNNLSYVRAALTLSRPGSLIVVDNIVRNGTVLDPTSGEPAAAAHELMDFLAAEGFKATVVQTVGSKGYDGFCLIRVPD